MRDLVRRRLGWLLASMGIAAALANDPNARGPLAYAVDYWFAERDESAAEEFDRARPILESMAIDPQLLEFPEFAEAATRFDSSTHLDRARLRTTLDRLCRDGRCADLLTAFALARSGALEEAQILSDPWLRDDDTPRAKRLVEWLISSAEQPR